MTHRMELRFIECVPCKSQPGSPLLCESCLNNRAVIDRLSRAVDLTQRLIDVLAGITQIETLKNLLNYPKNCICKKPWFENPECRIHGR